MKLEILSPLPRPTAPRLSRYPEVTPEEQLYKKKFPKRQVLSKHFQKKCSHPSVSLLPVPVEDLLLTVTLPV